MNQTIFQVAEIPLMKFENLSDITAYQKMTTTDKAEHFAKNICDYIKVVDKNNLYYYNTNTKLWQTAENKDLVNFAFEYFNEAHKTILEIYETAGELSKGQEKCRDAITKNFDSRIWIEDVVKRASSFLSDVKFVNKINSKLHIFPIKNGQKIDLRTLEITDRVKTDYITDENNVTLVDKTPHADKFFKQIMPNDECREYMRRVLGYTLTGDVTGRAFFIWFGHGSNGKSVIFDLLNSIMEKYYLQCAKSIFIKTRETSAGGANPDMLSLVNKRAIVYSEGETSDKIEMNLSVMKQISGDDKINARGLYTSPIEFKSVGKLHMLSNFTPSLNEEKAIVDRCHYLFLDTEFAINPKKGQMKARPEFVQNLKTKWIDEVFTWIAKGSKMYYEMGLMKPEAFNIRTQELFSREDSISAFLSRMVIDTGNKKDYVSKNDLWDEYQKYCNDDSLRTHRRSELYDRMKEKKYNMTTLNGYSIFRGLKFYDPDENKVKDETEDYIDIVKLRLMNTQLKNRIKERIRKTIKRRIR